jgi:hypothetical protein
MTFHVAVKAWPPAALECTVEHPDGSTAVRTYVPWQQWFAVAIAAFGIAIFTPPVPDDEVKWVRRALVTLALLVAGVGLWFF